MIERMTDEQKLADLYDKWDQLDREYEMAVSAYDIKGVWDYCRRCEENRQEIHQIKTAQLRTDLAATREKLRVARDVLESVRFKAAQQDPAYKGMRTNGRMPRWDGVAEKIDDTLARLTTPEGDPQ